MTYEADPRRWNELWMRPTIPDRREVAIGLPVDLSGSMSGSPARNALLGTVLLAETLERLGVDYATQHVRKFYPEHRADVPIRRLAAEIGAVIEQVLVGGAAA